MRSLTWFAQHPRLRNGLVLIAAVAVLLGGARLWTSVPPDAVHITITHVDGDDGMRPAIKTVTYDRTISNGAVAQRLQRDLAALPLIPFSEYFSNLLCPLGHPTYDAYTLTWYRAGLPVEQASEERTGCALWRDDGAFVHWPINDQALYADIEGALGAGG